MRVYRYVGPEHVRLAAAGARSGTPIHTRADLARWTTEHARDRQGDSIPATFVVVPDGTLRLASRHSEHIACAGGGDVLAAGELFLDESQVIEASNLSTGYCPEPACWTAVAEALDRAGVARPKSFTHTFEFRRCTCGERNLVKDAVFECAVCGAELPASWNFA